MWVERRKAENWLARECLRHWRRTMKKKAHVSYLPILAESPDTGHRGAQSAGKKNTKPALGGTENGRRDARDPKWELVKAENRGAGGIPHAEKFHDFIH